MVTTSRKVSVRTRAGYRIIALPHRMTTLIRNVIDVFVTDPLTGEIARSKRLVPAIRSDEGGAESPRNRMIHFTVGL